MLRFFFILLFIASPLMAEEAFLNEESQETRLLSTLKEGHISLSEEALAELKDGLALYASDFDFRAFAKKYTLPQSFIDLGVKIYPPKGVYKGPIFTLKPADDQGRALNVAE